MQDMRISSDQIAMHKHLYRAGRLSFHRRKCCYLTGIPDLSFFFSREPSPPALSCQPQIAPLQGRVVIQFGSRWSKRLPALKTGGLYKTYYQQRRTVL
jgi:hypothetical protein